MKKTKKELVPLNDPAQVSLAFYSIRSSIERLVKATEAQTAVLTKALRSQTEVIEEMTDVLRATNEILVQSALEKRSGRDLTRVRKQIAAAKKTLTRKKT